jgi:hypothetical protein
MKKALMIQGLFPWCASSFSGQLTKAALWLLGQQAALVWHETPKLEVRAENNWLIRGDSDSERNVSNAVESGTTG